MSFHIKPIRRAFSLHEHVARRLNPIIRNINRGHVVDSRSVTAERLPDGRLRLHLEKESAAAASLPLAAPPPAGCTNPSALNYDPLAIIDDGSCTYPPPTCDEGTVSEMSIQATLSGYTPSSDEVCGEVTIPLSATTSTASRSPCVISCITPDTLVSYSCPEGCFEQGDVFFNAEASLTWDGANWYLIVNIHFSGDSYYANCICGRSCDLGGDDIYELALGSDPTGTHSISFDDPNYPSVHYDLVVHITA